MGRPSVGRIVHYFDREEVVTAREQGREPQPYAAMITRVQLDPATNEVSDRVDLAVFDPELGYQFKRNVLPQTDEQTATSWAWPPLVNGAQATTTGGSDKSEPPPSDSKGRPGTRARGKGASATS